MSLRWFDPGEIGSGEVGPGEVGPGEIGSGEIGSGAPLVIAVARSQDGVRRTAVHAHAWGQLLGTLGGLSTVGTEAGRWVIPPTTAVWVPPHHPHDFASHGPFRGWSVYVAERLCGAMPDRPRALRMSGLLREAVTRVTHWPAGQASPARRRLALVLLDEIVAAPDAPFDLPMPRDARLLRVARAIVADPAGRRRLAAWASWAGVAPRTLTRRFPNETGYTFTQWQQRARLLKALELLAGGASVTSVSLDLGYESVSGFIALFKTVFGVTPAQHVRAMAASAP